MEFNVQSVSFRFLLYCFLGSALLLPGCNSQKEQSAGKDASTKKAEVPLPKDLFASKALENVKGVAELRKGKKEGEEAKKGYHGVKKGEEVTLTGYIGGRAEPFVEKRAAFLLADVGLPPCEDACDFPWDACCETPETIAANVATIQVVDEKGKPLKAELKNKKGLKPGGHVIVKGVVQEGNENILLINAKQIYVKP